MNQGDIHPQESERVALPLASQFLGALSPQHPSRAPGAIVLPELEATLRGLVDEARRAWPDVQSDESAAIAQLARGTQADAPLLTALTRAHFSDVFLVVAHLRGCARATAELVALIDAATKAIQGSLLSDWDDANEVRQLASKLLLVGDGSAAPQVARYFGRGALARWLRVAVYHIAAGLPRKRKALLAGASVPSHLAVLAATPEIELIKERHKTLFAETVKKAFATLSAHQRGVLRLRFLCGMRVDAIAVLYGVHRVSASRWIHEAQEQVLTETRQLLAGELALSPAEVDSLIAMLTSQLDLSVVAVLGEAE